MMFPKRNLKKDYGWGIKISIFRLSIIQLTLNIYLYCYWIGRNIWFKGIQHNFSVKLMYYLYSILHCNSITNTVFSTVFSKIGHSAVNSTINCKIFRQRWNRLFTYHIFSHQKFLMKRFENALIAFCDQALDGRLLTILKSCAKQMRNVKPAVTTWVKYLLLNLFRNFDRLYSKRQ